MDRKTRFNIWFVIFAFLGVLAFQYVWQAARTVATISYSEFQQLARDDKVADVIITENHIQGRLKEPLSDGRSQFITRKVESDLARELAAKGVTVTGATEETFVGQVLSWVLPALVFVGVWILLMRRFASSGLGGGFMQIGKSKARIYVETDTRVTFDDVAGVDEAKEELREIVSFLKDPATYGRLGARTPKGVLLVGPPGTGKTLLARAVAGEAGVPFFSISGSEFVEMFVGVGAARVRDLFEQARVKAPAIIFIDELDALGRARGAYPGGGHDEKETTLNQLLVEMDGFDPRSGLVLLAATNRPEILDPALLRAGRFDRQVLVDRPDKAGRIQILRVHLRKAKVATEVDVEQLAALTPGFSGADLANLVNEAAIIATRRGGETVTMADFTTAVERIVAGLERRNRLLNPFERRVVAYHEMGHALVAMSLAGTDPVHKVSIIPRGIGALGYTIQRPTEDRFLMTREELENKMAVLLGGRAAEHIVFGHLSTGATDDLAKVTDIARGMVVRYGMSDALGHVAYETDRSSPLLGPVSAGGLVERRYSDETARDIDHAVRGIVDAAFGHAVDILTRRRDDLERTAARLLEKETLEEADLRELVGAVPNPPVPSRPPGLSVVGT